MAFDSFTMIEELFEIQVRLASKVSRGFKRFLFEDINWDSRCIGIVGARGVGKTTLILQYYRENFSSPEDCLYFAADHVNNPNLYGLFLGKRGFRPETGAVREAFFVNQTSQVLAIYSASKGDFWAGDYLLEVGGPNKNTRQIKEQVEKGFLVLDNLEVGAGKKIPLYLMGFLY